MFMVPTKIMPTLLSPLFSWKTKWRMALELFHPRNYGPDESVASFVKRHYGSEMVDRLADPLLSGIYGGEAASLSLRAVLPRFHAMENSHGSLGRALLATGKNARKKNARNKMSAGPRKPAPPVFTSLRNGMQHLAETVVSRLTPASLLTNAPVESVQPQAGGWVVSAGLQSDYFDGVIVALPAPAAAQVLAMASRELSVELGAIEYSSSIIVGLGYDGDVRQSLPPGFGFLVPRSEGQNPSCRDFRSQQIPPPRSRRPCLAALFFRRSQCRKRLVAGRGPDHRNRTQRTAADPRPARRAALRPRLPMEVRHGAVRRRTSRTPRSNRTPAPAIARTRTGGQRIPRHRRP